MGLGRPGSDALFGLGGHDVLRGGDGRDFIFGDGGPGFDTAGADPMDQLVSVEHERVCGD